MAAGVAGHQQLMALGWGGGGGGGFFLKEGGSQKRPSSLSLHFGLVARAVSLFDLPSLFFDAVDF